MNFNIKQLSAFFFMLCSLASYAQVDERIFIEISTIEDTRVRINSLSRFSNRIPHEQKTLRAKTHIELGKAYFEGVISMDSALWHLDQSLDLIVKDSIGSDSLFYRAHYLKGFYLRKWDKYEESLSALQKVLDSPDPEDVYMATIQLGKLYKDRGEFALCFKHYDNALAMAGSDLRKRIEVYQYISFAYSVKGTEYGERQNIRWLDSLEWGLNQIDEVIRNDYPALVQFNKGLAYQALGDMDQAIIHVNRAEQLMKDCCDQPDFLGLINEFQGQIALENGDYETGIEKIKSSIDLFQYSFDLTRSEGLAGTYHMLAQSYQEWNKPDSALQYIDLAIHDRLYGLNNNKLASSADFIEAALHNGEKNYLIQDLLLKGELYEALNENGLRSDLADSALDNYYLAEQILNVMSKFHFEEETKLFWRKDAKDIYHHIIQLLVQNGQVEKAFLYSEKSKYVLLDGHLKKNDIDIYQGGDQLLWKYKELQDEISIQEETYKNDQLRNNNIDQVRESLLHLRKQEEDLLKEIYDSDKEAYNSLFDWEAPDIKTIQLYLTENNQVLVSYFLHDLGSYAFKLAGHEMSYKELPPKAEVDNMIVDFHRDIQLKNEVRAEDYQDKSHALFILLLGRILAEEERDVIIIPDGLISILPFDVLVHEISKNPSYKNMRYLIHDYNISHYLNAKSIIRFKEPQEFDIEAIALAPTFISEGAHDKIRSELGELIGAQKEVEFIADVFDCKALTGEIGEEEFNHEFKNSSAILHIATHALLNSENPDHSKLVLRKNGSEKYDDLIHLFELKNKRINTDLVVLSACNTGSGQWRSGEGISSIGTAFNYAGSPNVVNTLWAIPDYSSSMLMKHFYQNLSVKMGKRSALQEAKQRFITNQLPKYVHPYYWSGFVYYGDNDPLQLKIRSQPFKQVFVLLALAITFLFFISFFKKE